MMIAKWFDHLPRRAYRPKFKRRNIPFFNDSPGAFALLDLIKLVGQA
jgi:hypothetical protein